MAQQKVAFRDCRPASAGLRGPARLGLIINDMVRNGEIKAPIVIGRDHLDAGSVASPYRETEGMRTAVTQWRLATVKCFSQCLRRGKLGFYSSRRRSGNRLFHSRRNGCGGRWHP